MTMPGSKACSVELDAFCTGLVGCADPLCASQAICTPDAGTPDSGPPDNPCITVTGQNGNISVNGTMFCENDGLGGLGGLGGGLLGGLFGGP
jgi:hypothetical protein